MVRVKKENPIPDYFPKDYYYCDSRRARDSVKITRSLVVLSKRRIYYNYHSSTLGKLRSLLSAPKAHSGVQTRVNLHITPYTTIFSLVLHSKFLLTLNLPSSRTQSSGTQFSRWNRRKRGRQGYSPDGCRRSCLYLAMAAAIVRNYCMYAEPVKEITIPSNFEK